MSNAITIIEFSISGAMLMMMALGIVFTALIPTTSRWEKRYFIALFSVLFLCSAVLFVDTILWENPDMLKVEKVIWFSEFLLVSALIFMPTLFLLHSCGESVKDSVLFKVSAALLGIYIVLLIVTQFTGFIYYTTPDAQCLRGPFFWVLMLPPVTILLLNFVGTVRRRGKLSKRHYVAHLICILPMTAAICVHMFVMAYLFIVFGMALCALLMYGLIISDNVQQFMHHQQEIANQRASIMMLQMRPHFICNTMMGIYYLCDKDPQQAKQVTLDFTTYLRQNFSAIANEDTVPFSDELKHTRAYLSVEQAQFEDRLFVEYDTPHTLFRVPPLTLQPLVENAVKHGMDQDGNPLHIVVKTRQTDKGSEIIVENDGPDFAPANDNEPHIALKNIRQRIEMMCKGTLTITPRPGGGTVVTVFIPKKQAEQ